MGEIPVGVGTGGRRQAVTAPLHWLSARATRGMRQLPDFIGIGAMKAGTTSLATYLFRHPSVGPPRRKEIHYFDSPEFQLGEGWYRAHFPVRRPGMLTGEASPYYLTPPPCPRRVHALVPGARLVVMLRNPVDRASPRRDHGWR